MTSHSRAMGKNDNAVIKGLDRQIMSRNGCLLYRIKQDKKPGRINTGPYMCQNKVLTTILNLVFGISTRLTFISQHFLHRKFHAVQAARVLSQTSS